jgi:hypothetical protein
MAKTTRVACKLPAGLTVDHVAKDGSAGTFTLKGAGDPSAIAGYGVTEVDADLFKSWINSEEGSTFTAVKKELIFALPDSDSKGDAAKERKALRSGAEPIDPTKPAVGVEPTDEQKKEIAKLDEEPGGQTVNVSAG